MTHQNRICTGCGIKKPQPQMHGLQINAAVGESRASLSGSTIIGSLLGNEASVKKVKAGMFNTSGRKHFRKKQVWHCGEKECRKKARAQHVSPWVASGGRKSFIMSALGILAALIWVLGTSGQG